MSDIIPADENVQLLISMGFLEEEEVRQALRLAKNDISEAIAYLTREQPGLTDQALVERNPSATEIGVDDMDSVRFPTTHLYELESRIFCSSWNVPYSPKESLARCLTAAVRLAKENVAEADENCLRFFDRSLPECFQKLLDSKEVWGWNSEIQKGIMGMLNLLMDLISTRLKHLPFNPNLVKLLALAFNPHNKYHSKQSNASGDTQFWMDEMGLANMYAVPGSRDKRGYLVSAVNRFCHNEGLVSMRNLFANHKLDCQEMQMLLEPFSLCVEHLNGEIVTQYIKPCALCAIKYVQGLKDSDLRTSQSQCIVDLVGTVNKLSRGLCLEEFELTKDTLHDLQLFLVLRLIKVPHFGARMQALKELTKLLESVTDVTKLNDNDNINIPADKISDWLSINKVLSLVLDGNIDQIQYVDRLKTLLAFLGPRLTCEEIQQMWSLRKGKAGVTVDNVFNILSQAGSKFHDEQIDHLLLLAEKNFEKEGEITQEHILRMLGNVGRGTHNEATKEKVVALMWSLSHNIHMTYSFVYGTLKEIVSVVDQVNSDKDDSFRHKYILLCIQDLVNGFHVYEVLWCLRTLIENMKGGNRSSTSSSYSYVTAGDKKKSTLNTLCEKHALIETVDSCLAHVHKSAVAKARLEPPRSSTPVDVDPDCETPVRRSPVQLRPDETSAMLLMPVSDSLMNIRRSSEPDFGPDLRMDDGHSYGEYVSCFLDFLRFVIKEGKQPLGWSRAKEIWHTLIEDSRACIYNSEAGLGWFRGLCLEYGEIENDTTQKILCEKLLKLDAKTLTNTGFQCFQTYFEKVNLNKKNLRENYSKIYEVENMDLVGMEFVWEVALTCLDMSIVTVAVDMLINYNFSLLSPALHIKRKENVHRKFLEKCSSRLGSTLLTLKNSCISLLLKDSMKIMGAVGVPRMVSVPPTSGEQKKRSIDRLLYIVTQYIWTVEQEHERPRAWIPHGATFYARTYTICAYIDEGGMKQEYRLVVHENEMLGSLRERIAGRLNMTEELNKLIIEVNGNELKCDLDLQTLKQLCLTPATCQIDGDVQVVVKKRSWSGGGVHCHKYRESVALSSGVIDNWINKNMDIDISEKCLPSYIIVFDSAVFELLYELASVDDPSICGSTRALMLLIPPDPSVLTVLSELDPKLSGSSASNSKSNSLERSKNSFTAKVKEVTSLDLKNKETSNKRKMKQHLSSSPKGSTAMSSDASIALLAMQSREDKLARLIQPSAPGMTAFRLMYNLEIISGRLLPTLLDEQAALNAKKLRDNFVGAKGVECLMSLLGRDSLPFNIDLKYRQQIYIRLIKLLNYLLCGQSELHEIVRLEKEGCAPVDPSSKACSSAGAWGGSDYHKLSNIDTPKSCMVLDITVEQFKALLSHLQRLIWASSAGMLAHIGSLDLKSPSNSSSGGTFSLSPRNRTSESSNGSSGDGPNEPLPSSVHSSLMNAYSCPTPFDKELAKNALKLMADCLLIRNKEAGQFFTLDYLADFILDILLLTQSESIRDFAEMQLLRMADIQTPVSVNNDRTAFTDTSKRPRVILLNILLRAHLPLWSSSSSVRGWGRRLMSQCGQYFSLRSRLLSSLSPQSVRTLQPSAVQMLDDEANWLRTYSCSADPTAADIDSVLLAGHMQLITTLAHQLSERKPKLGSRLIEPLVLEFLFPAAKLMNAHCMSNPDTWRQLQAADNRIRCQRLESRQAAYELLKELCVDCHDNFMIISNLLSNLHHQDSPQLAAEWEYQPLVIGKMSAGYVGLKNAGATCYMNAVIQQLYMEPGLPDAILSIDEPYLHETRDSILVELQRIFANLRESELQYYNPERFLQAFKLWGQNVNPREQQDAFEFYTCLIDQIDTELKKLGREELFKRKYQGVFLDQKICHGCPHKYEREEAFYALNLPLRNQGLQESLNEFVKGEILDRDNAYFCDKCGEKRTTLKRMCIKSLPPVLMIQLKRFDYDWEENRALKFNDHFQFPLSLDMHPYTSTGVGGNTMDDFVDATGLTPSTSNSTITPTPSAPHSLSSTPFCTIVTSPTGGMTNSAGTTPVGSPFQSGGILRKQMSSSTSLKRLIESGGAKYELVGVVVHSGQASAGHYYSYIKERRDTAVLSSTYNKWFKFNDTNVEPVPMSENFMENEWFGGKYQAKVDKNSFYPEERERYWNAYLLLYQRVGGGQRLSKPPKITFADSTKKSTSVCIPSLPSSPYANKISRRRDSLGELTALVEQGERQNLFRETNSIPTRIKEEIKEDNLNFARNRGIYDSEYFKLVSTIVQSVVSSDNSRPDVDEEAVKFVLKFLLNLGWHTRRSLRSTSSDWVHQIQTLVARTPDPCAKFVLELLTTNEKYLNMFLLEAEPSEVRFAFCEVVVSCVRCWFEVQRCICPEIDALINRLLSLVAQKAADHYQRSPALFAILLQYAQMDAIACDHLLGKQAFRILLDFLLSPTSPQFGPINRQITPSSPVKIPPLQALNRKWSSTQVRDMGSVYNTLCLLVLSCDVNGFRSATPATSVEQFVPQSCPMSNVGVVECRDEVYDIVFGQLMKNFQMELIFALNMVYETETYVSDLVQHCSMSNEKYTRWILIQLLYSCCMQPSNELTRTHSVMQNVMGLRDSLQQIRVDIVLDGCTKENQSGLLNIIKSSQTTDSRRTYNCIKFLVDLAQKFPLVAESLDRRTEEWTWAVDWLHDKMDGFGSGSSNVSLTCAQSNQESNSRTFQRTISAARTLESAAALLNKFNNAEEADTLDTPCIEIECSEDSNLSGDNLPAHTSPALPVNSKSNFYISSPRKGMESD